MSKWGTGVGIVNVHRGCLITHIGTVILQIITVLFNLCMLGSNILEEPSAWQGRACASDRAPPPGC